MSTKKTAGLGTGLSLAALAAAAAGAYYFYGSSRAKQHRKNLKAWAVKARGEVLERLGKLKDVSRETYENTVDEVLKNYRRLKQVSPMELRELGSELKGHWDAISGDIKRHSGNIKRITAKKSRSKK